MYFPNLNTNWILVILLFVIVTALASMIPGRGVSEDIPKKIDFNQHVRPILAQNCYVCHGPDSSTRKANLRLDNLVGATAKLENGGAAVIPGRPHKSMVIKRVSSTDPDFRMPPPEAKKTLSKQEIEILKKWIDQGASWKPHWAFVAPRKDLPNDLNKSTPAEIIDYYIAAGHSDKNLVPSSPADRNQLIRRVSFLLTGLPPSPEEIYAFETDTSNHAYETMIDQYLESPHFGERWARHWMDLVRYGEYMGHEFDYPIFGAWHYRDYLIRAFNQDVPYDQLVKEHLAGDLLDIPRYNPERNFNESIIGTGYLYLGEGKHSPVDVKQEEADRIDNMIDVTSKTFLAMTVGCARCHDHKFDPIPTKDYYAMYGMFESIRFGPHPVYNTREQDENFKKLQQLKKRIRIDIGQMMAEGPEILSQDTTKELKEFMEDTQEQPNHEKNDQDYEILADFRAGEWDDWHADGKAFGTSPLMAEPFFDEQATKVTDVISGAVSSRYYGKGIPGALRSPNFIIEHDSIAVLASGVNGTIRVIADNFQVIEYPLYGGLEKVVDHKGWRTYVLDVSLVKGHKAYLQFMPGSFGIHDRALPKHIYHLQPEDYVEVQYAIAFNGSLPTKMPFPRAGNLPATSPDRKEIVDAWVHNRNPGTSAEYAPQLQNEIKKISISDSLSRLIRSYHSTAKRLHNPTHFLAAHEGEPVFSSVFHRGSIRQQSKEKVPRQFLSFSGSDSLSYLQDGSGRLEWAESVVNKDNPLTGRVIVNRIWHHLFGRGIVETVDNFGLQGKLPSHPKLLDYLALQFIEDGWSIKQMIRHILLTESFRRSTHKTEANLALDPENRYLYSYPVRRLEAEAIRDGILAVAECLDPIMYGEPVPIYLTPFSTGRGKPAESGPLDGAGRRSIYISIRRNFLDPLMLTFDMPIPFSTFGRRNVTNVPAQSLALLNDPFVHEQAGFWAENILQYRGLTIEERIDLIYLRAFARRATTDERKKATSLLENIANQYQQSLDELRDDPRLWADYCHTIFNLKEFIYLL